MWIIHFTDGTSVLYEGEGTVTPFEQDGLAVSFGKAPGCYTFHIWKDRLEIHSSQEVDVKMKLEPGRKSTVEVNSPYGLLKMEAETKFYEAGEEKMHVGYELNGDIFDFELEWKEQVQEYGSRH